MRALKPVLITTSVALALAGTAAFGQANMSARPTAPSGTATTTTTTSTPGGSATGTPGTTAGPSVSGTSSGDAFTGSSRNPTSGQTSGTSASGTSSGDAFTGSSRGNAPPVGAGANANTPNPLNPNAGGAIFNANGERIGTLPGAPVVNPDTGAVVGGSGAIVGGAGTTGGTDTTTSANANNNATLNGATADTRIGAATSTPELDAATRREQQRQRRTVEGKGQMMHSLTPRTGVDRTDQMPDDSTPLLSPGRR